MNITPKVLLNQLIANNALKSDLADTYEVDSLKKNIDITDYLFDNSNIPRIEIVKAISQIIGIDYVDLSVSPIDSLAVSLIAESISRKYKIIPYLYNPKDQSVKIATSNPYDVALIDFLEKKTNKRIVFSLADEKQIDKMIDLAYSQGLSPEVRDALKEYQPNHVQTTTREAPVVLREAPIAKIVSTVLEFAVKSRASDIHIEPEEQRTKVRYRIDGVLHEKLSLPKSLHDALISRIKILSEMKIDEKRIPQDGRFSFNVSDEEVDLRVSTLPTVNGEKVVMRLLKKTGGIPGLLDLGMRGPQLKDIEESILKPYGIILITGPTGSGKTTTLYSLLSRLNKPGVNISTLEDPVEYQIPGINQVQVNVQAGLTFATGLRSFLRQDPNIILVGEIRDKETTQLAVQAALTGHLVFSTLHTNDSATAIPRLIDLGAESFLIASVLSSIVAQRICRRVCPTCKTEYEPPAQVVDNIKTVLGPYFPQVYQTKPVKLAKGAGCSQCNQTGYLGRVAIFEVLRINQYITKMILQHESAKGIETQAIKDGMIMMKQDGYLKVLDGITTIEEVLRVAEV